MWLFLLACEGDKLQQDTGRVEDTVMEPSGEDSAVPEPIDVGAVSISCGDELCHNDEQWVCSVDVGDGLSVVIRWEHEGVVLGNNATLDASLTNLKPSDTVSCVATVSDPNGERDAVESQVTATVDNRIPSTPMMTLSWNSESSQPGGEDDVQCTLSNSVDLDGQTIQSVVSWQLDGVSTVVEGETLSSEHTQGGQDWTCSGYTTDGIDASSTVSATISISESCLYAGCDWTISIGEQMDWMYIPAGDDPLGRYSIATGFYMMSTEVTQATFESVMGYSSGQGQNMNWGVGPNVPAYFVSWNMAADFANALTVAYNAQYNETLSECYTCTGTTTEVECIDAMDPYNCDGFRLPTEAEWEYASRSGTSEEFWTADGGGGYSETVCEPTVEILDGLGNPLLGEFGWFCGNSNGVNHDVATKTPNGFGLYDTIGNLREWTADWYEYGFVSSGVNPYQSIDTGTKTLRGGNLDATPFGMQVSHRNNRQANNRYYGYGFRLIRMD